MIIRSLFYCAAAVLASPDFSVGEAFYVDSTLDFQGQLLDWRFVDLLGDERLELVVVVGEKKRERELRVYALEGGRLQREPVRKLSLLDDILAWGMADVRREKGPELLFLTPGGIWSYSLEHSGYRDNVRALVQADLIFDLADPGQCGYWDYVLPRRGGDLVVVPEREGATIWGPTHAGEPSIDADPSYLRLLSLEISEQSGTVDSSPGRSSREGSVSIGGDGATISSGETSGIFMEENPRANAALLSASFRIGAPALFDIDGDGLLDVLHLEDERLLIQRGQVDGSAFGPVQTEVLPEVLVEAEDTDPDLRLVDLDGDGDLDLLVHLAQEADGFKNSLQRLFVFKNDGHTLLREKPDQQLRFEAAVLRLDVADVDGDGRVDLAVRKLELPSLLASVSGLEFTFSHLVFFGKRKGFARKPALKQEQTFDEESIVDVVANREIALDCDGDGLADLVEIDVKGGIAIRRMQHESSFFGGDDWSLEAAPWKRFESGGEIDSLQIEDYNGDGLGDIASAGERRLTLFLSAGGGQR